MRLDVATDIISILLSAVFLIFAIALLMLSIHEINLMRNFPRLGVDETVKSDNMLPMVSIIVPARNEEHRISSCLDSLLALDYAHKEIIVVDDESTDRTPEILRAYQSCATVVRTDPLPPGWIGKPWACHTGFHYARGDVLLFTDADTVHERLSLAAAVQYLCVHNVDLLTLWPKMVMVGFWEKLILPVVFNLMFLDFEGKRVNDDAKDDFAAFGMYLLFKRDAYVDVGGHSAVKNSTEEDYCFAQLIKKAGLRLRVLLGTEMIQTRMYHDLSSLWEGWVKNTFEGFHYDVKYTLTAMAQITLLFLIPYLVFGVGIVLAFFGQTNLLLWGTLLALISWGRELILYHLAGYDRRYVVLFPFAVLICLAIIWTSMIRGLTGKGRRWKGRLYR